MKKCILLFLLCISVPVMAQDSYIYNTLVSTINKVGAPRVEGDYVIFTAEATSRHVGIAFQHEGFKTIHNFQRIDTKDTEEKIINSLYFYVLEVPQDLKTVSYRLVVDGLWTVDPLNANRVFDQNMGLVLSTVNVQRQEVHATKVTTNNTVRFVYQGESGQQIRLGGSFTNWDSSIYTMREVAPGLYQLDLPLPQGTYYYAYYHGITPLVDKTNPQRGYTPDGKVASVITVQ